MKTAADVLALLEDQINSVRSEPEVGTLVVASAGAVALSDEYDVCFRTTWRGPNYERWLREANGGADVVTQHYCGSPAQRAYYYSHFNELVAPTLTGSSAGP